MLENSYLDLSLIVWCISEVFYWLGVKPRILQTENSNNSYGLTEKENQFDCNPKHYL